MTDLFALLGEPRRPFLDPERIKETFHRLSRTEHPDQQTAPAVAADAGFAQLNLAQATLRDPKTRLRHLLELEFPAVRLSGPSTVPPALGDLFAPIHGLLREIDALLSRKANAPSAWPVPCCPARNLPSASGPKPPWNNSKRSTPLRRKTCEPSTPPGNPTLQTPPPVCTSFTSVFPTWRVGPTNCASGCSNWACR